MWSGVTITVRVAMLMWLLGMMAGSALLGYKLGRLKGLKQNMATLDRIKRHKREREEAAP